MINSDLQRQNDEFAPPNGAESSPSRETSDIARAPMGRQLGIAGAISVAAVLTIFVLGRRPAASDAPPPPAAGDATTDAVTVTAQGKHELQIRTEPARTASPGTTLTTTGIVSLPADRQTVVSPRLSGRIRQVFVRVGDHVKAGQVLATMDSVDAANAQTTAVENADKYRLAQSELDRQENLYRLGTPEVTTAQAALDQAKENERFTKAALTKIREQARIGGFTQQPLAEAQSAAVQAQSDFTNAKTTESAARREHDRTQRLFDIGIAAKRDLDAAADTSAQASESVAAGEKKVALTAQTLAREGRAFGSNLYAAQQIQTSEAAYNQAGLQRIAAEKALQQARAAVRRSLQQAESATFGAKADAANSANSLILYGHPRPDGALDIHAPISGTVTQRSVNPGQTVDNSGQTPWQMFTVVNPGKVWVDADAFEHDLSGIKTGDRVRVTSDSLRGYVGTGKVTYLTPGLDPKTHAVKVRTEIPDSGGLLKDGMYVTIAIERAGGDRTADRVVVPIVAVQNDGDRHFVLVAVANGSVDGGGVAGKYRKRYVRLGSQVGDDRIVVQDGLKPGERVVTQGALFLNASGPGGD